MIRVLVALACNPSNSADLRRITVQSQSGQIVQETQSEKNPSHTHNRKADGVAYGVGPEFKLQF
jgi:hypothetical protein